MKLLPILAIAALSGFGTAGAAIARDAKLDSADAYATDKRSPQHNTYGKAYTLKMKDDGFKKREPQHNTYGKAYTLKMEDDGFEKRDPQHNAYGRAYTLKMEDDV
ncbi:hypothetical protein ACLX1H_003147 [Fusarium chlamydosporum]